MNAVDALCSICNKPFRWLGVTPIVCAGCRTPRQLGLFKGQKFRPLQLADPQNPELHLLNTRYEVDQQRVPDLPNQGEERE